MTNAQRAQRIGVKTREAIGILDAGGDAPVAKFR
jgi:hypothetical protein